MGKLNVKQIEAIKTSGKYFDGNGLYLNVTKKGSKLWRGKYRFNGKEKTASYGAYPEVGLREARDKHAAFRLQISSGIDPLTVKADNKKAAIIETESIFSNVAWAWYKQSSNAIGWGKKRKKQVKGQLSNHIVKCFGERDIRSISPKEITVFIQKLHQSGINYTARECLATIRRIFAYAVRMELTENSPAALLTDVIPSVPSVPFKHCIDPKRIGEILLILERAPVNQIATKAVVRLSPMLFTRPGELRQMKWQELDGDLWHIPAERMKMRRPLTVPLPRQAVEIIESMRLHTGQFDYVLANTKTGKPISEGAAQRLKIHHGLHHEITWHGWRHTASTLLNEKGYNKDYIETQLAHLDDNSVRGTYNHAQYLEQRRKMMQDWADFLDELKAQTLTEKH